MPAYLYLFLSAIAASAFPIVGSELFDVPLSPGIVAIDIFIVAGLFSIKRKIWWNVILSVPLIVWCILGREAYDSVTAGYYLALLWLSHWVLQSAKDASEFDKVRHGSFPSPTAPLRMTLAHILHWQPKYPERFFTLFLSLYVLLAGWSLFMEMGFSMRLSELWGVAKFFWWGAALFIAVPALQLAILFIFFRYVFRDVPKFKFSIFVFSVAGLLGIHAAVAQVQVRQPILNFSVYEFFKQQLSPGRITQSAVLRQDAKERFTILNDVDSLKNEIRPTVMILVESWGLRKEFRLNEEEFNLFDSNAVAYMGIWRRHANFTQGAEFEDFGMPQGKKASPTLMETFDSAGFDTWYVHGYEGKFYERNSSYDTLGFKHTLFKEEFVAKGLTLCNDYGFAGICDSALAGYIDSLLTDSVPKFIYWTTLDSHPPFETQKVPESKICEGLSDVECIHGVHIRKTLRLIAALAQKHPQYRFILRGDHRPMGTFTSSDFVVSFYHCWVPMVVLN